MLILGAVVLTFAAGYLGTALFDAWMNWPQAGPVLAVAVMGAYILYAIRSQRQDKDDTQ